MTQNELIACCGNAIQFDIVREIKSAKFFTIPADEARDNSNQEQMSLFIRFIDKDFSITEDFIGFLHCSEGLSGKALSSIILKKLVEVNLDIKDCRGQGYDGAGAVAGSINGCSAHILKENSKALYTHCFTPAQFSDC